MRKTSPKNEPTANSTASWWALCSLTLAASLSGCAQPQPPSPPVLFKPARVQPPDPELMTPPKPSGAYLTDARNDVLTWQQMLSNSLPKSEGSKPGPAAP